MIHAYVEKARDIMSYLQWWEFTFFALVAVWVGWIVFDVPSLFGFLRMKIDLLWWRLRGSRD